MNQPIDLDAWRRDGEGLWGQIQERKFVANYWNNPWYRFAAIGAALVIATVVTELLWGNHYVSAVLGILALPCVFTAARYFWIGVQTGGLYSFFSESGFGIGCDADRLSIPYSAMQLPERISPATANENYILLPVRAETGGIIIERKNGPDIPWDGTTLQTRNRNSPNQRWPTSGTRLPKRIHRASVLLNLSTMPLLGF